MDQASVFDDADGESYQFNDDQVKDIKVYESIKTSCSVCNVGTLNKEGNPVTVVVYGRNGVFLVKHQYKRCNFKNQGNPCRAGHYLGYRIYNGIHIYDDDLLKNEILFVTKNTAFTLDFLVEVVGKMDISSETFEAAAKSYNRFHHKTLPFDVMDKRVMLVDKRLNQAVTLFMFIEISQRYGVPNYQMVKTLDAAILEMRPTLMRLYRLR